MHLEILGRTYQQFLIMHTNKTCLTYKYNLGIIDRFVGIHRNYLPAALLAEPLGHDRSGGDDNRCLGVVLAYPVPPVIALGFGEIGRAAVHLTTQRMVPVCIPGSWGQVVATVASVVEAVDPQLRVLRCPEARHVPVEQGRKVALQRRWKEGTPGEITVGVTSSEVVRC